MDTFWLGYDLSSKEYRNCSIKKGYSYHTCSAQEDRCSAKKNLGTLCTIHFFKLFLPCGILIISKFSSKKNIGFNCAASMDEKHSGA